MAAAWADDYDTIRAAREVIRANEAQRCPVDSNRKLYDCLRSLSRCGDSCQYRDDWIGPQ